VQVVSLSPTFRHNTSVAYPRKRQFKNNTENRWLGEFNGAVWAVIRSQGKYRNQSGCWSIKVSAKDMEVG
jgi:hypothetical protein